MSITRDLPLAVTMGEPAGIGGELVIKAWLGRKVRQTPSFFVIDAPDRLQSLARKLDLEISIAPISSPKFVANLFSKSLPVMPIPVPELSKPGLPDAINSTAVLESIKVATSLALAGQVSAVVTNPINKQVLYKGGFPYPGHTELLADLSGAMSKPVMMLVSQDLKVAPVTVHLSLSEAIKALNKKRIVTTVQTVAKALVKDFGIKQPQIAVAGLNPHAGEGGFLGCEEVEIITPAVTKLRSEGFSVTGPMPADTLFHQRARLTYDVVICMYHDQALLPVKTLGFFNGVNVTLGLPIVRTSPDHGTALEIAGTGIADESSFISALRLATDIYKCREKYTQR